MKKRFYEYDVLCGAMHDVVLENGAKHRCIDAGMILDLPKADVVEVVRCKDCKHWKDSDGVYRRGVDAESKCPLNLKEVYEGTFYCGKAERRTDD